MPLTKDTAHRQDLTSGIGEMQHRHFATIATIIRESTLLGNDATFSADERAKVALLFAGRLRATNSNFDRRRFLLACGVEA